MAEDFLQIPDRGMDFKFDRYPIIFLGRISGRVSDQAEYIYKTNFQLELKETAIILNRIE